MHLMCSCTSISWCTDDVSASIACTSTTKTITNSGCNTASSSATASNFYSGSFVILMGSNDYI